MAELKIPQKTLQDNFNLQDFKDDFNALNSETSRLEEIANTWETFKSSGGEIGGDLIASTLKSWGDTMVDGNLWIGNFSREPNGYTKLPNGLIMQWGHLNLGNNLGSGVIRVTVSFPIQFPNDILHTYLTPHVNHYFVNDEYSSSWERPPVSCQITPSNFEFAFQRIHEHYGAGITWFAIGY